MTWIEEERQATKQELEQTRKYVKLNQGDNEIELDLHQRTINVRNKFGNNVKEWKTTSNKKLEVGLFLHELLLNAIPTNAEEQGKITVIIKKTGERDDTRYEVRVKQ